MRVYTAIRCYDIEVTRRADGSVPQQSQQPAPQQQQAAPQAQPMNTQQIAQQLQAVPANDPLPTADPNDGLPF